MTFFVIFSKKVFKKIIFFSKFEIPSLYVVGDSQSNLRGCKFGLQLRMFKFFSSVFVIFLENFRKLKLQNISLK